MNPATNSIALLAVAVSLAACTAMPSPEPAPDASGVSEEPSSSSAGATVPVGSEASPSPLEDSEDSEDSSLKLVQDVAARTAQLYDPEHAENEEVSMRLRLRVAGKPAALAAEGPSIAVLTGAAGAGEADVTVELLEEQARAIADGSTTLKRTVFAGGVETDNEQGLARFMEFLTH